VPLLAIKIYGKTDQIKGALKAVSTKLINVKTPVNFQFKK